MFGRKKEDDVGLLPKDILVDLESNPNRADEMLEKFVKGEPDTLDFGGSTFMTASAFSSQGLNRSSLEMALRQMENQQQDLMRRAEFERAAQMQNQIGGLRNAGFSQGLGNALGGLGGLLGPNR